MDEDIFTDLILELNRRPQNFGTLENPDLHLEGGNPLCGDQVHFDLRFNSGTIEDIKFSGHGCSISRAAESLLTTMVKGKRIDEALTVTSAEILSSLGNIIQLRMKCALLGLHVLHTGLKEYSGNGGVKTVKGIRI